MKHSDFFSTYLKFLFGVDMTVVSLDGRMFLSVSVDNLLRSCLLKCIFFVTALPLWTWNKCKALNTHFHYECKQRGFALAVCSGGGSRCTGLSRQTAHEFAHGVATSFPFTLAPGCCARSS